MKEEMSPAPEQRFFMGQFVRSETYGDGVVVALRHNCFDRLLCIVKFDGEETEITFDACSGQFNFYEANPALDIRAREVKGSRFNDAYLNYTLTAVASFVVGWVVAVANQAKCLDRWLPM